MLSLRNLSVAYGKVIAVSELSIDVAAGEVVALVGANGAGKSSTLKALAGVASHTGKIRLDGKDIENLPTHKRVPAGLALSPEGRQVFPGMSVLENLHTGALPEPAAKTSARIDEMMTLFPRLRERAGQAAGTLSGGEQTMVAIARALMSRPRLLMLDEPTLGLAPIIVKQLAELIATLKAAGMAILLSEQNVEMALAVSDRAYVLESGVLVKTGPSAALAQDPLIQSAYLGL